MKNSIYFAYGSNLNEKDLREWANRSGRDYPLEKIISRASLVDYELVFNHKSFTRKCGTLNIRPATGKVVEGMIFEVKGSQGWQAIDDKEGAPRNYKRVTVRVLDSQGGIIDVQTYESARPGEFIDPTREYLEIVKEGYLRHDIDTEPLLSVRQNQPHPFYADGVFVYGTLMRGESRFQCMDLGQMECILLATAHGKLADLGPYPGLVLTGERNSYVSGEFVRVRDIVELLQTLDEIEGFNGFDNDNSLYCRIPIEVDAGDGRIRPAWTYLCASPTESLKYITSGDWREHRGVREQFIDSLVNAHCNGQEQRIARELSTQRLPWAMAVNVDETTLLPLSAAVMRGELSERRLAQHSEKWVVVP